MSLLEKHSIFVKLCFFCYISIFRHITTNLWVHTRCWWVSSKDRSHVFQSLTKDRLLLHRGWYTKSTEICTKTAETAIQIHRSYTCPSRESNTRPPSFKAHASQAKQSVKVFVMKFTKLSPLKSVKILISATVRFRQRPI